MTESRDWLAERGYIAKTPKEQAQRLRERNKGLKDCCTEDRDLLAKIKHFESVDSWKELYG